MKNVLKLAFAGAIATHALAMPAYSADLSPVSACSCAGGSSATLAAVAGKVTATGSSGLVGAKEGQILTSGSEVFTRSGSAVIALDSGCTVQVGSQSRASIVSDNGAGICVEVASDVAGNALPSGGGLFSLSTVLPAVLVAGAVAGIVIIATDDDDDDDVEPVSP